MAYEFWRTDEEIQYIGNIGLHLSDRHELHIPKLDRKSSKADQDAHTVRVLMRKREFLKRYLEIAAQRSNWDRIDKDHVVRFAEQELARVERSMPSMSSC